MFALWGKTRVHLFQGDITDQEVDAIVNAANSTLLGGGGVDGAIHRKGGPMILEECKRVRQRDFPAGLPSGGAVITTGGRLKAKHVIHTVGPVWRGGQNSEAETLADCYRNSLGIAIREGLQRCVPLDQHWCLRVSNRDGQQDSDEDSQGVRRRRGATGRSDVRPVFRWRPESLPRCLARTRMSEVRAIACPFHLGFLFLPMTSLVSFEIQSRYPRSPPSTRNAIISGVS